MEAGAGLQLPADVTVAATARGDDPMSAVTGAADIPDDDCCNDGETRAKSGQPCKTGQECSAPAFPLTAARLDATVVSSSTPRPASPTAHGPTGQPATVWRPPADR